MARRFIHSTIVKKRRQSFSKLFNKEDEAKLAWLYDTHFKEFVKTHNGGLSIANLYTIYKGGMVQLTLF